MFKFELEDRVTIKESGEQGEVRGRCEYIVGENQYLMRYKEATGNACECFWGESALTL